MTYKPPGPSQYEKLCLSCDRVDSTCMSCDTSSLPLFRYKLKKIISHIVSKPPLFFTCRNVSQNRDASTESCYESLPWRWHSLASRSRPMRLGPFWDGRPCILSIAPCGFALGKVAQFWGWFHFLSLHRVIYGKYYRRNMMLTQATFCQKTDCQQGCKIHKFEI